MRRMPRIRLLVVMLGLLAGACGPGSVLVTVPPRIDLAPYPTLGIMDFSSRGDAALGSRAARQFQEQVQAAQPRTRFIELGDRDTVLAAVGAKQFDAAAARKIGEKYGVAAVFVGELVYSEPSVEVKLMDVAKLEGGVRAEVKGDMASRLVETATGASVWTRSSWARRQVGSVNVSSQHGVSGGTGAANPREAMLPTLVYQLTHDFRPSTTRQPAK